MMKKILNVFALIIIVLTAILWVYTNRKESSPIMESYAVKSNYCLLNTTNKTFSVTIYLTQKNNVIQYLSENDFFLCNKKEDILFELEAKSIIKDDYQKYKDKNVYPYIITFGNPQIDYNYSIEKAYLKIINSSFKLKIEIGTYTNHNPKDKNSNLLNYNTLYGIYNVVKDLNLMVGVVIDFKLRKEEALNIKMSCNDFIGFNVDKALIIDEMNNEDKIEDYIENYSIYEVNPPSSLTLKTSGKYLIPVGYAKKYYTNNIFIEIKTVDGYFYIDNFTFQSNILNLESYASLVEKGE